MKLPILDNRLKSIADEIPHNSKVADIGTDHGYLIAYLAAMGKISRGYACDINEKPLKSAEKTMRQYGVTDKVNCLLGSGLSALSPDDVDTIVIAGMGGELILSILKESHWNFSCKRLLLQPMTKAEKLRTELSSLGFKIEKEIIVNEGKFVYSIMSVIFDNNPIICDEIYSFIGEVPNSSSKDKDLYLIRIKNNLNERIQGLTNTIGKENEITSYKSIVNHIEKIIEKG